MDQKINPVDQYIQTFPPNIQELLEQVRKTILNNAPDATEGISYGMPAYRTNNIPLVYFAAFSKHIGFYATPSGHDSFAKKLSGYKQGKGSVQFPFDQPIPYELIAEIVTFRVLENKIKESKIRMNKQTEKPNP